MDATTDRYAKGFSDLADVYVDLTHRATRLIELARIEPGESSARRRLRARQAGYVEAVRTPDGRAEIPFEFHYWCFTR